MLDGFAGSGSTTFASGDVRVVFPNWKFTIQPPDTRSVPEPVLLSPPPLLREHRLELIVFTRYHVHEQQRDGT